MTSAQPGPDLLTALRIAHTEWRPLLALIEEALWEIERPEWQDSVPSVPLSGSGPDSLLSSATISVASRPIERWVRRVLVTAAGMGSDAPFVDAATARRIDPRALFRAAVAQDMARLDIISRAAGDRRGVLHGLAPLIAMPLLHACRRAWAGSAPAAWPHGHCRTCGAWPTLAEIRGLEGARHLRCRRCGGEWVTEWLRCPFCGERDHARLGSLVSAERLGREKIEVCDRCHGYLKTITTFGPIRPQDVVLETSPPSCWTWPRSSVATGLRIPGDRSRSGSSPRPSGLRALLARV
jgi:FdhE protein